VIKNLITF